MKKANLQLVLFLLTLIHAASSTAQDIRWEAGVGLVGVTLPMYPGSSQDASYLIPFPYLRLESKYLNVDQALEIARAWLHGNARRFFGLPIPE